MHKKNLLILAVALAGCQQRQTGNANPSAAAYFDVKEYFAKEATRLNQLQKPIEKTVWAKGKQQTKKMIITHWQKELEVFANADINKKAWRGSFTKLIKANSTIYTGNSQKIPVKQLKIIGDSKQPDTLIVILADSNYLYVKKDTLTYSPNKFYTIRSSQKVKTNQPIHYAVAAKFK